MVHAHAERDAQSLGQPDIEQIVADLGSQARTLLRALVLAWPQRADAAGIE